MGEEEDRAEEDVERRKRENLPTVSVHYHSLPKWQTQAVSSSGCVSAVSLHTD